MKKIITYLIVFSFFISGFLILIPEQASASITEKLIINWELQNAGLTSGYNDNCTYESIDLGGGGSSVRNGEGRDSSKGFRLDNNYDVVKLWVNFTSNYAYVSKVCMWLEDLQATANYVSFYNSDNTRVLYFKFNGDKIEFYDAGSGWTILKSTVTGESGWLNITHITGNQMNYTWYEQGASTTYKEGAGSDSEDWDNIARVYFTANVSSNTLVMDDLIIFFDTVLPDDCIDSYYSSYNVPEYAGLPTSLYNGQYVEHQYTSFTSYGLTGELTMVRLVISQDQYLLVSNNPDNYTLVVNGENFGSADDIYYRDSGSYYVRWNISKILGNSEPIFSFGCNKLYDSGALYFYWFGLGVETSAIWGSKEHNTSALHTNNIFDGDTYDPDIAYEFYLECVVEFEPPDDTNETDDYYDIYFKFYDASRQDNNLLYFKGLDVDESLMGSRDYAECLIYSSLSTDGFRYDYSLLDTFTATLLFTDGDYMDFHFASDGYTNFNCRIDDTIIKFKAIEKTYQLYAGQTYNVLLYPVYYIDGVNYSYEGGRDYTDGYVTIQLTKQFYDFGETLRMRYKLPTLFWLEKNGWKTNSWYISIYNTDDYFLNMRWDNWLYVNRHELIPEDFDGEWHTWNFVIQEYTNPSKNEIYGYFNHFADYEIAIINFNAGIFDKVEMFEGLKFYVSGEDFVPSGNITSISPNPCYFGQPVTFTWTSNGEGRLEVCYPNGEIYFSVPYGYSDGTWEVTKTITAIGNLPINLYTRSNLMTSNNSLPVDTDTLICNPLGANGTFGSFGYGIPYLYIPVYRGIAGYDTIYIYYRTYKNDSTLIIKSPRYETTYFSTTVSNQSDNVLAIELPNYMQIGDWNVTLYGGDIYDNNITLYSSFNVVNEEGNWIEFEKHTYTDDELFSIYVKHTYRVAITFYKNNVAHGKTLIFDVGEQDNVLYIVPADIVTPSIGQWRVEMWRINDRNIVYELAEWECNVIAGGFIEDIGAQYGFEIPEWVKLIIGIAITLLMTIAPLLLINIVNKKSRKSVDLPALVYVGFFFFGMIIAVLLGFMPIVVPFIVLLGLIIGFTVMWLRGHPIGGK